MKKREVFSIIDSLEKINSSVSRNLDANIPVATETVADCQNAAIAIGNEIEKQGQAGEEVVCLLEDYCENIYHMNCMQTDIKQCRKLTKKIQKQLVQIRNRVKYDLPDDKKQIVFLPYKASMWDSLESVWKAADDDPDCDALVIPVPYYDKSPDGSFQEMHYEGEQYPNYVPIISWEEYDIEANHPDVIYIHNPYDEYNMVTSVHPAYYSIELKKYTDELIYIPYFILEEVDPNNQAAVNGMEHFCAVPAVAHADKVFVQSEKMRQVYINVMTETMGADTRKIWEKKIFGLGSPKIDKVLNTRKEELEIPAEWLKVIKKPDGSWKKIVFYNTGISSLLTVNELMIQKMSSVFEFFKENQDEVALLWRPHPLIESTLTSMRPQLWEQYKTVRDKYIQEGWGIYDITSDLDRAVILCDAYYGDGSSVAVLINYCQKPILFQNVDIENNKDYFAKFMPLLKVGEYMLVSFVEYNALCSINLDNGEMNYIGEFDEEDFGKYNLYWRAITSGNKIIVFPCSGEKIHILDAGDWHEIGNYSFRKQEDQLKDLFFAGIDEQNVYLITDDVSAVYKFDKTDCKAEKMNIVMNKIDGFFPKSACMDSGKIYMVGSRFPLIVCIDLIREKMTVGKVEGEESGFSGIMIYDNSLYLLSNNHAYIISITNGNMEYYKLNEPIREVAGSIVKNNCWIIGSRRNRECVIFDFIQKSVSYKVLSEALFGGNQADDYAQYCFMYGENQYGYYIDGATEKEIKLSLDEDQSFRIFEQHISTGNFKLCEASAGITIDNLLKYLNYNSYVHMVDEQIESNGQKIYRC